VIAELGKDVKNFAIGDRVMLYKHKGRPTPPLRHNPRVSYSSPSQRKGAYAEYLTIPTSWITRVPDELSDKQAATLEPLVAAIHAVRLGKMKLSDSVAFIGTGPIALLMIQRVR
jgi:threonine dehydrogenase-like Zn-dependent dehydrogenase